MDSDTQLKPCPFCGELPEIEVAQGGAEDVACFNVHCLTQPRSLGIAGEISGREVWNTRAFPSEEDKKLLQDIANWFEQAWAADGFSKPLQELLERMK